MLFDIALSGKMASGKTTIAEYLVTNYNYVRMLLAQPIKDVVDNLEGNSTPFLMHEYIMPHCELSEKERKLFYSAIDSTRSILKEEPKPRKRYQYFGTEGGRSIRNTIWIEILLNRRKEIENPVVVDDLRFSNEAEYLSANGFTIVKLFVPRDEQIERLTELYGKFDENVLTHASESEIDLIEEDFLIDSNEVMLDDIDNIVRKNNKYEELYV